MNILMLGWELPPHNSGGLGVACFHMSKALAQNGASIDFVVPYEAVHDGVDFMRVHSATSLSPLHKNGMGAYASPSIVDALHRKPDESLNDIRGVQRAYGQFVERLLETVSPDAIHAHDWLTIEAGIRAKEITGAPLIVHVHATEFDRAGSAQGNPLVHEIEQQGLLIADRIIAVSNLTKALIVQRYEIPADKIEVMHNAMSSDDLDPYDYDRRTYRYLEHLKGEGVTVAATVTRFTVQKGLAHFMKAAARACERYDKLVFLFAGDGEQRDELLRMSAKLGIADRVFFTGFVRGKQWRDAYEVADIFVMSSVSEPFGLTALEAAHHGNALLISKQSGVGEVLSSVMRFDFWDTDKLADQMIGIATSNVLKEELQRGVRREYARISWNDVAKRCLALYKRLEHGAYA
jgi:glycogen(starch) synthase